MRILIDRKILQAKQAFSTIGEVTALNGSEITPRIAADADVLVTRTTTKVTEELLRNSNIKFVATATAGTDHIDLEYLARHKIGFTSAPGCNSVAVGEFVINALVQLTADKPLSLENKTLGIIGAGNAGSALRKKAECLGLKCLLNDPPLHEKGGNEAYIPLLELVSQSDIISLHVPLIKTGPHPTYHLINSHVFKAMKAGTILVNTSRGGVVCETDLHEHKSRLGGLILDVWENEPEIDFNSLKQADIASPHIAGYSLDGKFKATEIVYQKTCHYFGCTPTWLSPRIHEQQPQAVRLEKHSSPLAALLSQTYDIYKDDSNLRLILESKNPELHFRELRNNYEFRKEFANFQVSFDKSIEPSLVKKIQCLGFLVN